MNVKISDETLTLGHVASVYLFRQMFFYTTNTASIEAIVLSLFPARNAGELWCTIANIRRELYTLLNYDDERLSNHGKWLVRVDSRGVGAGKFALLKKESRDQHV